MHQRSKATSTALPARANLHDGWENSCKEAVDRLVHKGTRRVAPTYETKRWPRQPPGPSAFTGRFELRRMLGSRSERTPHDAG